MYINNKEVKGEKFAYEGCHKIYIIEDSQDEKDAIEIGYNIYPISELEEIYLESCSLKFIRNWKLDKVYALQFENAIFSYK